MAIDLPPRRCQVQIGRMIKFNLNMKAQEQIRARQRETGGWEPRSGGQRLEVEDRRPEDGRQGPEATGWRLGRSEQAEHISITYTLYNSLPM